jgi:hypothetical protein
MFWRLSRSKRPHNACQRLRAAVDAMPPASREAMLRGIDHNTIIVGAYVDSPSGGICPMLAAHRNGGRTDLASFARCWDRYTDADRPRPATSRELRTLVTLLEGSLVADIDLPTASHRRAQVTAPERPGFPIRIRRLRPRSAQVANAEGSPGRAKTTSGIRQ